jgi:hypothetical protein
MPVKKDNINIQDIKEIFMGTDKQTGYQHIIIYNYIHLCARKAINVNPMISSNIILDWKKHVGANINKTIQTS